jgi:hypothetical protein
VRFRALQRKGRIRMKRVEGGRCGEREEQIKERKGLRKMRTTDNGKKEKGRKEGKVEGERHTK